MGVETNQDSQVLKGADHAPVARAPLLSQQSIRALAQQDHADVELDIAPYILDRSAISVGIIAIGGSSQFHRGLIGYLAHLALKNGDTTSGICAVSVRNGCEELKQQDGLYTLNRRDFGAMHYEVVGSIIESRSLSSESELIMQRFEDPAVRCVTTVVTPAGYHLDQNGFLNLKDDNIKADLLSPNTPSTTIGLIVEGIRRRADLDTQHERISKLAIIPCDNFPPILDVENGTLRGLGDILKQALIDFAVASKQHDLALYIKNFVAVPNTQVDRICPKPTSSDKEVMAELFGVRDLMPVPTEPDYSLVIEDRDPAPTPSLPYFQQNDTPAWLCQEHVHLTSQAKQWCEMKTFSLNLVHVMVAWIGKRHGKDGHEVHRILDEHPEVVTFLTNTLLHECQPLLEIPSSLKARGGYEEYVTNIIKRLRNFSLPDTIDRLDTRGTEKIRERVLPLIKKGEALARTYEQIDESEWPAPAKRIARLSIFVAVWALCVTTQKDEKGNSIILQSDPHVSKWTFNLETEDGIKAMLAQELIFGTDRHELANFKWYFRKALHLLRQQGLQQVLHSLNKSPDAHTFLTEDPNKN